MGAQNEKATIDLVINGKQALATGKELTKSYLEQRKILINMAEADPGYAKQKKLVEDLMRAQQARIVKLNEEKTAWERFATSTTSVMAGFVGGDLISTGISKISSAIRSGVDNYRAFDAASKDLSAVTGATGQDLAYLNQQAASMGPTFGKTGAEMLEAYKLMASAKPELLDQKELLVATTEAAITLAQAGKIDLATATKVTAESLNQFGEGADQANRYINVIAAGAKAGSAEINEMGAALKNSGTVAAAQNVSFEQSNAVLQSLSSIALKGGEAGTALRNVLLTLGAGSDDTNPRVVGLDKALENLGKKNLSTAEMTKLFGKENITAAQHIITHREEIAELTKNVTGTSEAFSQAAKNNESFDHKMEVFNAKITKLATILGTAVIPAITKVVELGIDLADLLSDGLTPASVEATQAFDDQRKKVGELTRNLTPLLDRHDELKKKTILNKDEQAELKKIVGQVANIVPSAVTEFDKYGNALGVNTGKARDFIKVQKELLKYNNKKAIDETDSDLAAKQKARDIAVAKLNLGKTQERDLTSMGGAYKSRAMTEDERRAMQADIQKLNGEIKDLEARKSGLTGSYLDTPAGKPAAPATGTGKPATGGGGGKPSGESDDEKKAREKAQREADAKVTANKKAELAIEEMQVNAIKDEEQRDLAHAVLKANREKEEVRTSAANADKKKVWIQGIEDALVVEKIKIEEKYTKKKNEEQEKQNAATLKAAESELDVVRATEQAKVDEMVAAGELTEEQGKVAKLTNEETYLEAKLLLNEAHYQALAELYAKDAEKKKEIETQKKDATAQITGEITANEGQQATARKDVGDAEVKRNAANAKQQADDQAEGVRRKKEIFNDATAVMKGFFKENTVIYKAAMIAQQAWALGEVAVNYSRSVMASIAGASGIPFPGNLAAIAKSLAIPTLQAAAAVANIRKQKFDAPQFAAGGFTDTDAMPTGFTNGPTYYSKKNFVAGEAGTEWIMSAPMLQNPLFANLAGAMQALQASGQYKNIGTGGGGTSANTSQGGSSSDGILLAMYEQLVANNEKMEQISKRPINYDYFAVQNKQDEVARIDTETTL